MFICVWLLFLNCVFFFVFHCQIKKRNITAAAFLKKNPPKIFQCKSSVSMDMWLKWLTRDIFCSVVLWVAALLVFGNLSDKKVEVLSVIREKEGSENSPFMLPVILRTEEMSLEPGGLTWLQSHTYTHTDAVDAARYICTDRHTLQT